MSGTMKLPLVAPMYAAGKEPLPPGVSEDDRQQLNDMMRWQKFGSEAMESCASKTVISGVLGFGLGAFFSLMGASFAMDDPVRESMIQKMAAERAEREGISKVGAAKAAEVPRAASAQNSVLSATNAAPSTGNSSVLRAAGDAGRAAFENVANAAKNTKVAQSMPTAPKLPDVNSMATTKEYFIQTGRGMWSTGKGFGKVGALYSGIECVIEGYRAKNDIINPVVAGFFSGAILARNSGMQAMIGGGFAFAAFSGAIDLLCVLTNQFAEGTIR